MNASAPSSTTHTATSTTFSSAARGAEPDAHVVSRHLQTALLLLLIGFTLATIALLFLAPSYTYLAVIPIPFLMLGRGVAKAMEVSTTASELRHGDQDSVAKDEMAADLQMVAIMTIVKVFGVLALGTFVIATMYFDAAAVAIAAVAFLLMTLLIELPFILAGVEEAQADEREKLTGNREA
ncbi:cation transporter-like permease [Rhodopirellula rubra]|uniref:Cation transporter-like permease n=1 Tax=Aporhodopirellula rubra TaxID=980271 RepID=A0A7W5E343_9BACT|nr:hypothetical protein [Aporhodopirellula rubra]MBB3209326.1 cation transporter-like permease [Aporhodopirellula rubra]